MQSATFTQIIIPKTAEYAQWSLELDVVETLSTVTDIAGTVEVFLLRDSTAGDPQATGYHFNGGNSLKVNIGGINVLNTANVGPVQINGGASARHSLWSGTWTGKKDSNGAYAQVFSATFAQTQPQGAAWNGTVSGTFVGTTVSPIPSSNVFVYSGGEWKRGTPYIYTNGAWKKTQGRAFSVYTSSGWKK